MIKFIFTLILILSFSFASQETNQETVGADQYYASLNQEEKVLSADYGKKKNKSPLRKRYLKRKRKVRNPAQGK